MNDSLKTRSEAQREASRRNGAKSRGPVTPEGKARSSQNSRRSPLHSATLYPGEDRTQYLTHLQENEKTYQPRTPDEQFLVDTIARAKWELHRVHDAMSGLLRDGILHDLDKIHTDNIGRLGSAWKHLADNSRVMDLLMRRENLLLRIIHNATRELGQLRGNSNDGKLFYPVPTPGFCVDEPNNFPEINNDWLEANPSQPGTNPPEPGTNPSEPDTNPSRTDENPTNSK